MKIKRNRIKAVILFAISILSMLSCFSKCTYVYAKDLKQSNYNNGNTNNIIPKPLSYKEGSGKFKITKDTVIYIKGNSEEENMEIMKIADYINEKISAPTGFKLNIVRSNNMNRNGINLTTVGGKQSQGNEGYTLV
ncbi:MAG: glycoside hydrolase family 20 zincin-like fold domain-containing protein, partial [Clostridium sp.]|nr:glycoside hydrolase family 20 zincin-like fold domain-containing protein [Clostridium sp.]